MTYRGSVGGGKNIRWKKAGQLEVERDLGTTYWIMIERETRHRRGNLC